MNNLRLASISLLYYVVSGVNARGWSGVTFRDDFPEDPQKISQLPTIAVSHVNTRILPYQLSRGSQFNRLFQVIVYAGSDGVRDDLAQDVADHIYESTADLKNYNLSFPPPFGSGAEPTITGKIDFQNISMSPSVNIDAQHTAARHIMTISFTGIIYNDS